MVKSVMEKWQHVHNNLAFYGGKLNKALKTNKKRIRKMAGMYKESNN